MHAACLYSGYHNYFVPFFAAESVYADEADKQADKIPAVYIF